MSSTQDPRIIRRHWQQRSTLLRRAGLTWDQIACVIGLDHPEASPLRRYRYAHGWSAPTSTEYFNATEPTGTSPLSPGRLLEYETWPASGGRMPPVWLLTVMARVYQTRANNLIPDTTARPHRRYTPADLDTLDAADHRHIDSNHAAAVASCRRTRWAAPQQPVHAMLKEPPQTRPSAVSPAESAELLDVINATEADPMRRRDLFQLALAFGGLPAMPILRHLSGEETDRLTHALVGQGRLDGQTVTALENLTAACRRLDDVHGPGRVLPVVQHQRWLVSDLLATHSTLPGLRDRLVRTQAQLCQVEGWLHYDLMNYDLAVSCLLQARESALEVNDATLIAYIHDWLADLSVDLHRPGEAMDHVHAAQGWARRSSSRLLAARTHYEHALALALNGESAASRRALDAAQAEASKPSDADPSYLYWVAPYLASGQDNMWVFAVLRQPADTIHAAKVHLKTSDPRHHRIRAYALALTAEALVENKEIEAAAGALAEAGEATTSHSSVRVIHRIRQTRTRLEPWATIRPVIQLDERLRRSGIATAV